jgi:tetratricopeptide (TPR) repeat protein
MLRPYFLFSAKLCLLLAMGFAPAPTGWAQPASSEPTEHVDVAERLLIRGAPQAAIDTLAQADSLRPEGYFLLGRAHQALYDHPRAADAFAQADTTSAAVLAAWGQSLRQLGRPAEARARYRQAYEQDPRNRSVTLALADLHLQTRQPTEAVALLQPMVERTADNPLLHTRLAKAYQSMDSTQAAIRHFRRAFALNPQSVPVSLRLSGLYATVDSLEAARTTVAQALDHHPDNLALWKQRGTIAFKRQDYPMAIRSYQAAAYLGDSTAVTLRNLGQAYYLTDDYEAALPLLKQSLRGEDHALTALFAGIAHKNLGQPDSSLVYLQKATELFRQSALADVYEQIADAHKQLDQYEEAIDADRLSLRLNPDKHAVYFHLATLYDDYYADPKPALMHYRLFVQRADSAAYPQMRAYARYRMQVLGERDFFRRPPAPPNEPASVTDSSR